MFVRRAVSICILLVTSFALHAQNQSILINESPGIFQYFNVTGRILGADDHQPLTGAHVSFINKSDTTGSFHAITNIMGDFSIKLPRGEYIVKASFVGYSTLIFEGEEALCVSGEDIRMGELFLSSGAELEEVEIAGYRPAAHLRGDTLDYDAQAFKVAQDANVEDLVRRMPGITVEDGRVTAQGEDVRKVLVDGREFFGDDPTIALRNLPAEVVSRVEVFDRLSDQAELTGFDDGIRSKTINIVTRLDTRGGQFGRLYSGYGGDGRYQAGVSTNIFKDQRRISILGMSNNVNEQNFSREDIISLSAGAIRGGTGRGMGRGMGRMAQGESTTGHVSDFRVDPRYGDNTTHALGVNYTDSWFDDRLKLTGSYFFNIADNFTDQFTDRRYFFDETGQQLYLENSESDNRNSNHRVNLRAIWEIDDKNSLIIVPGMTIQGNTMGNYLNATNLLHANNIISMSETLFNSDLSGINYGGSLVHSYKFGKTGRTFSTNLSARSTDNMSLYYLDAMNEYLSGTGDQEQGEIALSDYLRQQSDSRTVNRNLSSHFTYTEPLGERSLLQAGYQVSGAISEAEKETLGWDSLTNTYSLPETELSGILKSHYNTHRGALGYLLRGSKYSLTLEMAFQHALLSSSHSTPIDYSLNKNFQNLLPRLMLNYDFNTGKSLRLNYRTSTSPPPVTQLQNIVDNTNPVLLSSGNPDLEHSYSHFFMTRYNVVDPGKSTNFILALFGNFTGNYIGGSSLIAREDTLLADGFLLKKGSQLSQPANLDGFFNVRSHLAYGFPLRFIKSNLNLNFGLAMVRTPGIINGLDNFAKTYTTSGGCMLSSNISPEIDFSLSYNANYNIVENTLQPNLDKNYLYQSGSTRFSFIFLRNWVFRNDLNYLSYRGLGEGFNQDYLLWNMNIGRKLFHNNLGEITLSVFDLLDQNRNIVRNVADAYVEDLRTNQITRFFMVSFTYNLRNFHIAGN